MTEEERGTLLARNRVVHDLPAPPLMTGLGIGILLAMLICIDASLFPRYAAVWIGVGIPVVLGFTVLLVWWLNRTFFRPAPSLLTLDPAGPYAGDLQADMVEERPYTATQALRVNAVGSPAYFLDIGEGKLLFLQGACLYDLADRFPCHAFTIIYLPQAWEVLRIDCDPSEPIPMADLHKRRFPKGTTFPRSGDVIEGTLAAWSARITDGGASLPASKQTIDWRSLPKRLHPDLLPLQKIALGQQRIGVIIGTVLCLGSAGICYYLIFVLNQRWQLPDNMLLPFLMIAFLIGLGVLIGSLFSPARTLRDLRLATAALATEPSSMPIQVYYYPSDSQEKTSEHERQVTVCLPGPFTEAMRIPPEFPVHIPGNELWKKLLALDFRAWNKPEGFRYRLFSEEAPVYLGPDGMVVIRTRKGLLARCGD